MSASLRSVSLAILAAIVAASALAVPHDADAASGGGHVALTLPGGTGAAAVKLHAEGVAVSAIAPARRRGKPIGLPVASLSVRAVATVALRGGIRLRARERALALHGVRVRVAKREVVVSVRVGKRRIAVFSARPGKRRVRLDRALGTARLAGARLRLTRAGARLLGVRLGLDRLVAGAVGGLTVDARSKGSPGATGPGGPGGKKPDTPRSGPISHEPSPLARPASAVDVGDVTIAWYPRDSWVRYVSSGTGPQDGIFATGGATEGAPMATPDHPCSDVDYPGSGQFDYELHYAPKSGWYDPVSGQAALYGTGEVRFHWAGHGIDLAAADPEIEIAGAASRAIFRFRGTGGTAYENQRAELIALDLAGQPTGTTGNTRTYTAMAGSLSEDGEAVFAGFYPAGGPFGCVSASFTSP